MNPLSSHRTGSLVDFIPTVITEDALNTRKNILNAHIEGTDAAVESATGLSPVVKEAWKAWLLSWKAFFIKPYPFLGLGASADGVMIYRFEQDLAQWQDKLASEGIHLATPKKTEDKLPDSESVMSTVKIVAIAAAVGLGVYGLSMVLPFIPKPPKSSRS